MKNLWSPIVTPGSSLSIDIHKRISTISSCLIDDVDRRESRGVGLLNGDMGIAIFFMYYGKYTNNHQLQAKGFSLIERIFSQINTDGYKINLSLATGLSGVCLGIQHLVHHGYIHASLTSIFSDVEKQLFQSMRDTIDVGVYDFLHGALGIALFFFSSGITPNFTSLEYMVSALENKSIKTSDGVTWLSGLDFEKGLMGYNLSLSHGICSIIVFLSKMYKAHICQDQSYNLIINAVRFLKSCDIKMKTFHNHFPNWICESELSEESRLSWCYGDLGIGIALLHASLNINDNNLKQYAINLLLDTTQRCDLEKDHVIDAGLCHGSSGIAHIFNRAFYYTNIEKFKTTAQFWFNKVNEMGDVEDGLAGFKAYNYGRWVKDPTFLEGISGIGLSLLASVSYIDPNWDEFLLLS